MGTKDYRVAIWYLIQFIDKYGAALAQALNYEAIVDHFMPNIDRCTK
jgi:hypothetical protein